MISEMAATRVWTTPTLNGNLPTVTFYEDLMGEILRVLMHHRSSGGCTEEGCGCPGSQLQVLYGRLKVEFPR